QQRVEILGQCGEAARDALDQLARQAQLRALDEVQQRLGLGAEQRDALQVDERERAMRLVQRSARGAQRRQIVAVVAARELLAKLRFAGRQCPADLAQAPRERGEV